MKKPSKALIVDDVFDLGEAIALECQLRGFESKAVVSVDAAIEVLKQEPFDIILCDVRMPRRSGIELLDWVRLQSQFKDTAFILMSAFSDISLRHAFDRGADAVLVKPFGMDDLFQILWMVQQRSKDRWGQDPGFGDFAVPLQAQFKNMQEAMTSGELQWGRGGLFMALDHSDIPPVHSVINFSIHFENGDISTLKGIGIIRWHSPVRNESYDWPGIGIEMIYADPLLRIWLGQHLKEKSPIPFIPKGAIVAA